MITGHKAGDEVTGLCFKQNVYSIEVRAVAETISIKGEEKNQAGAGSKLAPATIALSPLFLPEDPAEAQRVFNSLPAQNQLEIVLQVRGKERLLYLFLSENPEQLVQSLPELEVFLTVKEVGEKDALDLISITTPEQFQYFLDLEFWKKDELDPEKIFHWMEILLECGEKKVNQFIRSTDLELITLLLKKFLQVTTLEGEPLEVRDRISLFTLDQHYFILFKKSETRVIFQPFLEIFYRADTNSYRKVMEALIVELGSELEEEGYRLRNARMADYGFPDFEEALEIYSFVNPDSLSLEEDFTPVKKHEEGDKSSSTFYLTFQNEGPFLSSVLSRIDDPSALNRLMEEIAALCNKAIVAESIDRFTIEEMERVSKKVFHYLDLGLQYLSREEDPRAFEILRSFPLQKIFQCGVGATLLLRKKAESILKCPWFAGDRENLVFLDPPYLGKFQGILKKRPTLYRNGGFGDFKSLHDLKEIELFLESLEVIVNTVEKKLNVSPHELKELDLTLCYPKDWREITLSTIFLTSLANQVLYGVFRFEAIEQARLKELLAHLFDRNEQGKGVVKMEIKKGIKDWIDSISDDQNKREHLLAFWDFCLDLFAEQYGRIPPGGEVDPRFVEGLLIHT